MKIMFICTGNICRSAMAEGLLKKKLYDRKITTIDVCSSGLYASIGDMPTYEARRVMEEYGVDISKHRAVNTKYSNVEEMDLILCSTASHKKSLLNWYPKLEGKVFTMKEYVGYNREFHDAIDIKDPWGYDLDTYRSCAGEIDECLELLINKVK